MENMENMENMDKAGAMAAEWARTNVLRMLATAIGIVMVWPYVFHLVSLIRQALDRATAQERERAMALRALQERCVVFGRENMFMRGLILPNFQFPRDVPPSFE